MFSFDSLIAFRFQLLTKLQKWQTKIPVLGPWRISLWREWKYICNYIQSQIKWEIKNTTIYHRCSLPYQWWIILRQFKALLTIHQNFQPLNFVFLISYIYEVRGKWSLKNGPLEKWSLEKWSLKKWSLEKWSAGKMFPGKIVPGKMAPWKNGPWKNGPRKNGPQKNGPLEKNAQIKKKLALSINIQGSYPNHLVTAIILE